MITIQQADILEWARTYTGPKFHALLCDPPYHLTSITERFGGQDAAPAQHGKDGAFGRLSKGFMGKVWDGGDIAFRPETWATLAEHLHPGAFGMAFASSRGWHRLACAIEDAGLIIHPSIFGWVFGSGFPKATRIDTQVDRLAGAERQIVGQRKHAPKFDAAGHGYREKDNGYNSRERTAFDVTAPATDMAADWQGYRYGLQAMKPALEPIIVFQKPYVGRPVECIVSTGAGALNIDAGRIGAETLLEQRAGQSQIGTFVCRDMVTPERTGRWPANLILQHTPDCAPSACVAECPVTRLGAQTEGGQRTHGTTYGKPNERGAQRFTNTTGTAARFFYQADWSLDVAERLAGADPTAYVAKSSRAEREAGLDPRTCAMMRLLDDSDDLPAELLESDRPGRQNDRIFADQDDRFRPTTVDDGRQTPIDNPYLRGQTTRRNTHPTIKPLTLARYLATLLLPPERYGEERRLLIPFAGAASEVCGAMLAGWPEVLGLELEADHVAIGQARIAYWLQRRHELLRPDAPITVRVARPVPVEQIDMFTEEAA